MGKCQIYISVKIRCVVKNNIDLSGKKIQKITTVKTMEHQN